MIRSFCFASLLSLGCANFSGLDQLDVTGDGGPNVLGSDVGADTSPVCQPTETDCTDGIDNDCNGKIDCADPACTSGGYSCTPELGQDLQFAWFADGTTPACPGTSTATDVVAKVTAPSTCDCGCTAQANCANPISVAFEENSQCTTVNNTQSLTADNACHNANNGFDIQAYSKAAGSTQATCQATATLPPAVPTGGRVCKSKLPKGGGGCNTGFACTQTQPAPMFKACAIASNGASCPTNLPVSTTLGTGVTDTRVCGACSCTPSGGCTETGSFYTDGACASLVASFSLNGCVASGVVATTVRSYKVTTSSTAACSNPPTTTVTGGVSLSGSMTLCCAN